MKIIQNFIPVGCANRKGIKLKKILGLVIHWIGVAQPRVSVIRNNFANYNRVGATQYIIDYNSGEIIQTMPEDEMTYHVGAKNYTKLKDSLVGKNQNPNNYFVGIECCISRRDKITNDYANKKTNLELGKPSENQYENLVDFSADFLIRNNLTVDNLYRHYDITGKACHVYFYKNEDKWQQFKKDVANRMEELNMVRYKSIEEVPEWYKASVEKLIKAGVISGTGNGLDLLEESARQWTIMDRLGILDFFIERRKEKCLMN